MLFTDTILVALESLRVNVVRSLLTMLGIVIGVGAVIAMEALGRGAQDAVSSRIAALGTTLAMLSRTMAEVERIMRLSHRLMPGQPDDFQIRNMSDYLNASAATTQSFTLLLAGIAAVSLLVGGIGIMNIMLVSVTERTREIGIRKSVGATRRVIMVQFLVEAVVLSRVGGTAGVLLGVAGARILSAVAGWNTTVSVGSVLLSFGFAALIGVGFGVWPARRAASLDPVESLRYE